jgi:hypothetical protein
MVWVMDDEKYGERVVVISKEQQRDIEDMLWDAVKHNVLSSANPYNQDEESWRSDFNAAWREEEENNG